MQDIENDPYEDSRPRECPRVYADNGTAVKSSVFCSFGCCPGTGRDLWECCNDPRMDNLNEMDWCTIVLVIIICAVVISLLVVGTCASYMYLKRTTEPRYEYPYRREEIRGDFPYAQDTQEAPMPWYQQPASPSRSPAAQPGTLYDTEVLPYTGNGPYPPLTPQQQAMMAYYWRAMYFNYMKQYTNQGRGPGT